MQELYPSHPHLPLPEIRTYIVEDIESRSILKIRNPIPGLNVVSLSCECKEIGIVTR